jgi:hypothetical protein
MAIPMVMEHIKLKEVHWLDSFSKDNLMENVYNEPKKDYLLANCYLNLGKMEN